MRSIVGFSFLVALTLLTPVSRAQSLRWDGSCARNVIVPQCRSFTVGSPGGVRLTHVKATVSIVEQTSVTTLDVGLANPTEVREEAELMLPVPAGAVIKSFTFDGAGLEPRVELLPQDEARRIYDSIVRKVRDPALLEFVGYQMIRSSVFPVEPRATQQIRVVYEQLLPADGRRVDYVLPRSESLAAVVPWEVTATIKSTQPIATVYSPSHAIETRRVDARRVTVKRGGASAMEPGAFQLSFLLDSGPVTASLLAYPDAGSDGGYFLLLAGLPPEVRERSPGIRRELTLVIDRSGSMNGKKLDQVKAAVRQILAGLDDGESFNIISYSDSIDAFSSTMVTKSDETLAQAVAYVSGLKAEGGTDLYSALRESLSLPTVTGSLPIVLFLTDGMPTVGEKSEVAIRELASHHNPHKRRVFTFGVGVDVNTPLLEKIASESRGVPTFVLPNEDVEVKVSRVFKRLDGPILAEPVLDGVSPDAANLARIQDVLPGRLPDLFEDDQLVVLGRYRGKDPLEFRLRGNYLGEDRTFRFRFDLKSASVRNSVVPRLWASRKIGVLVDAVRQLGADRTSAADKAAIAQDGRTQELVDEIVRLSTEFGILTEYTAFLAREGTDLANRELVLEECNSNLVDRAVGCRVGNGSVNQSCNGLAMQGQLSLNRGNWFLDANLSRVGVSNVCQLNDSTFYRRQNRWVDSRWVGEKTVAPVRELEFGTDEFRELLERLVTEGRQSSIALHGDVLLSVDGQPVLVKGLLPEADAEAKPAETKDAESSNGLVKKDDGC